MDDKIAQPFHAGELRAHHLAGGGPAGTGIRPAMPEQHRVFFGLLPFICIGLTDGEGWPIASILHGRPGFVLAPTPDRIEIDALPAEGDPARAALHAGAAIGLLGIELPTRRRNRANGTVIRHGSGISVAVDESFGNCPKYITVRTPQAKERERQPTWAFDALPERAAAIVRASDTLFAATSAGPHGGNDISHRGGQAGFVQVDGDSLLIPDYPGNRYFNTLGNLLLEPRCALLFADFASGDLLQLQGRAEVLWDRPAPGDPLSVRSWRMQVVRGWLHRGALPLGA